jgi:hypothetical protein
MYIIEPITDLNDQLRTQKLVNMTILFDKHNFERYKKIEDIDSKYIIGVISEPDFKPMMDEYLKKIIVNG